MLRRLFSLALALAFLAFLPAPAHAVLSSQDGKTAGRTATNNDVLEARQYRLPESRVAGQESMRQSVIVWQVTAGTWNGESLKGLSLVLVKCTTDSGEAGPTICCYISYVATAAQREALLGAFMAAQAISPGEVTSWRVEPAVITFEVSGKTVVVHLGLVA